jgi:hypothetical protein
MIHIYFIAWLAKHFFCSLPTFYSWGLNSGIFIHVVFCHLETAGKYWNSKGCGEKFIRKKGWLVLTVISWILIFGDIYPYWLTSTVTMIYCVVKLQLINMCICIFQVSSAFLFWVFLEIWNKKCQRMCVFVYMYIWEWSKCNKFKVLHVYGMEWVETWWL